MKPYYIYILTNRPETLYVGSTDNLQRRLREHQGGYGSGFTKRYKANVLLYFETEPDKAAAVRREMQIKRWGRDKKIKLIATQNPEWLDLSASLEATRGAS